MVKFYEEFNKQIPNKDDHIIIAIHREYIQEFVKANYGRELTESELDELSWLVWDEGDSDLINWIDEAVRVIIKEAKENKEK